jgi:hypothetical protein
MAAPRTYCTHAIRTCMDMYIQILNCYWLVYGTVTGNLCVSRQNLLGIHIFLFSGALLYVFKIV